MALPAIAAYPMPDASELPAPRVPWTVDPDRAVLLVHDMQHHFLRAFAAARPLVTRLIDNIAVVRAAATAAGVPVVFSAQPEAQSPAERGLQLDMWGTGVAAGEGGIVDDLRPQPGDHLMTKWRYSAFLHTELGGLLRSWGRDQLVVTGIYAHIGCMTTATEAFMRDVQAFLVADAVADFSREDHLMAVSYVARRAGVATTAERVAGDLAARHPAARHPAARHPAARRPAAHRPVAAASGAARPRTGA